MAAGRRVYVYYAVDESRLGAALDAVRDLQRELCRRHPGLDADLLRRPEPRDGRVTLMETYAAAGGVDDELAAEIARRAAERGLPQPRHVEVFEALP